MTKTVYSGYNFWGLFCTKDKISSEDVCGTGRCFDKETNKCVDKTGGGCDTDLHLFKKGCVTEGLFKDYQVNAEKICNHSDYKWTEHLSKCVKNCDPGFYEVVDVTLPDGRRCEPVKTCTSGDEYEIQAPTQTSDRQCAAATQCEDTEYEVAPPNGTQDRQCAKFTECTTNQYEAEAPLSPVSDRVCLPIKICEEETQYETAGPTGTTDRQCEDLKSCAHNEYQAMAPQSVKVPVGDEGVETVDMYVSDRTCEKIKLCDANHYQVQPPTFDKDRECTPLTSCGEDEYQSDAPATIQVEHNDESHPMYVSDRTCKTLTKCKTRQDYGTDYQAEYESESPTSDTAGFTSDRVCRRTELRLNGKPELSERIMDKESCRKALVALGEITPADPVEVQEMPGYAPGCFFRNVKQKKGAFVNTLEDDDKTGGCEATWARCALHVVPETTD